MSSPLAAADGGTVLLGEVDGVVDGLLSVPAELWANAAVTGSSAKRNTIVPLHICFLLLLLPPATLKGKKLAQLGRLACQITFFPESASLIEQHHRV